MKSLVQEASTIAKAVKQAWEIAGKPRDFSVKILEQPVYNFFGFTKRSAKVALLFEAETGPKEGVRGKTSFDQSSRAPRFQQRPIQNPRRSASSETPYGATQDAYQQHSSTPSRENRPQRETRDNREQSRDYRDRSEQRPRDARDSREPRGESRDVREPRGETRRQFTPRPLPVTPQPQQAVQQNTGTFPQMREEHPKRDEQTKFEATLRAPRTPLEAQWSEELLLSARTWFKEVLTLMGLGDVDFTFEVQDSNLNVIFSRCLIDEEAREKHLFASLSTLLVSTLKRQYRRALRGHRVILSHK